MTNKIYQLNLINSFFITLSPGITIVPHIHHFCHDSYYQLCQLCTFVRSLTPDAYAYITVRLDYCISL